MAIEKTGAVRKTLTRVLAAGALPAVYAVVTVTTSGVFLASTTTAANAQRGRGRGGGWGRGGRGGGWGRGRGGWGLPWLGRLVPSAVEQPPLLLLLSIRLLATAARAGRASGRFCIWATLGRHRSGKTRLLQDRTR